MTGEARIAGAAGLGGAWTGLGAFWVALGTCGNVATSVGVDGGVTGFVDGALSCSTDGDFFFRNSGFGGSSGFLVGFGVVGGVLGLGDARDGTVFGGEGAFFKGVGVGVEALGSVFSGVCCLAGAATAG